MSTTRSLPSYGIWLRKARSRLGFYTQRSRPCGCKHTHEPSRVEVPTRCASHVHFCIDSKCTLRRCNAAVYAVSLDLVDRNVHVGLDGQEVLADTHEDGGGRIQHVLCFPCKLARARSSKLKVLSAPLSVSQGHLAKSCCWLRDLPRHCPATRPLLSVEPDSISLEKQLILAVAFVECVGRAACSVAPGFRQAPVHCRS